MVHAQLTLGSLGQASTGKGTPERLLEGCGTPQAHMEAYKEVQDAAETAIQQKDWLVSMQCHKRCEVMNTGHSSHLWLLILTVTHRQHFSQHA